MNTTKQVRVNDETGLPLYNLLLDDGTNVMRFDRGNGFVTREDIVANGWTILNGWYPVDKNGRCDWGRK